MSKTGKQAKEGAKSLVKIMAMTAINPALGATTLLFETMKHTIIAVDVDEKDVESVSKGMDLLTGAADATTLLKK